jgi:hypothetical protein
MSTTTAISANPTRNNGGTVLFGGGVPTSPTNITNAPFLAIIGPTLDLLLQSGAANGNIFAKSAGTYGKMAAGSFVAMRMATSLAGISDTTLLTGAADFGQRKSINVNESNYTLHAVSSSWDYLTGQFNNNPVPVTNDSFGTDDAARPTRSVPGEFVYHEGKATPTQDDYDAKTGG